MNKWTNTFLLWVVLWCCDVYSCLLQREKWLERKWKMFHHFSSVSFQFCHLVSFLSYFIFFVRLLLLSLCQIFHPIKSTIHSIISLALVVSSIIFLSSFQLIVTFQQHLSYFISFGWVIHSSVIVERNRRENSNNNNKSPDSSSHSNQ